MYRFVLICLLASMFGSMAGASDLAREQRLKEQIIDAILDGEPVMLRAADHEFLSIYTEADAPKGAVLILHGRGFHPDWANVVSPLRVGLVEHGWHSLSIQLPVLEKAATFYDYEEIFDEVIPRLQAAFDFLHQQGNERVVVVAHSCGVHMAMHYIRNMGDQHFDAFVGIGMGATDFGQPMRQPFPLEQMRKPLLDVYGEDDYPAVQRLGALRAQQMHGEGHPLSAQVIVPAAEHYFVDRGDDLVDVVAAWLQKLP